MGLTVLFCRESVFVYIPSHLRSHTAVTCAPISSWADVYHCCITDIFAILMLKFVLTVCDTFSSLRIIFNVI
eukprot:m.1647920 g.1647920  ORF g.1647920 m.1647920 type:complete len:72 (+) comp77024_c0_seq1:120-335(+)